MSELIKLTNIGTALSQQLNAVGITTFDELKKAGSKETWLRILAMDPSACYNRLCALEGAIQGARWHYLPDEVKKDLKEFYTKVKRGG